MSKLSDYGGRMVQTDGTPTVELRGPNNNNTVFQYRRAAGGGIERRVIMGGGVPYPDGSPWESLSVSDLKHLHAVRGQWHPILDPLGM